MRPQPIVNYFGTNQVIHKETSNTNKTKYIHSKILQCNTSWKKPLKKVIKKKNFEAFFINLLNLKRVKI